VVGWGIRAAREIYVCTGTLVGTSFTPPVIDQSMLAEDSVEYVSTEYGVLPACFGDRARATRNGCIVGLPGCEAAGGYEEELGK
jgi:hypothetical protein